MSNRIECNSKEHTDNLHSQCLDLLRFPLAIVVLIVHVFSTTGGILNDSFTHSQLLPEVQRLVDVFLRGQSVPVYYFISGYVFFLGKEFTKQTFLNKLKNRVGTLLIPYIVWNTITLLFTVCISFISFKGIANKYSLDLSIPNILNCFWEYDGAIVGQKTNYGIPILGPTWFLRDLMVVVLCTPVLNFILKEKRGIFSICVFAFIWLYSNLYGFSMYFPSSALFFFSLGAFMSINKMDMIQKFGSVNLAAIILYSIISILLYNLNKTDSVVAYLGLKSVNTFIGLIVLFNISKYLLKKRYCKVNKLLASSSMFIYISHMIICGRILKLIFILVNPHSQVAIFTCYIATIVITLTILLSLFIITKRYTPKLLTFITGRR